MVRYLGGMYEVLRLNLIESTENIHNNKGVRSVYTFKRGVHFDYFSERFFLSYINVKYQKLSFNSIIK